MPVMLTAPVYSSAGGTLPAIVRVMVADAPPATVKVGLSTAIATPSAGRTVGIRRSRYRHGQRRRRGPEVGDLNLFGDRQRG